MEGGRERGGEREAGKSARARTRARVRARVDEPDHKQRSQAQRKPQYEIEMRCGEQYEVEMRESIRFNALGTTTHTHTCWSIERARTTSQAYSSDTSSAAR